MARNHAPRLPRPFAAQLDIESDIRAVAFSRVSERRRWIENELGRCGRPTLIPQSIAELVQILLGETGAPRPQLLVIDLDALTAGELFHLHRIRERGWSGTLIVLGRVPPSLRVSLGVDRALLPPFVEDALSEVVARHVHGSNATTVPIPLPL